MYTTTLQGDSIWPEIHHHHIGHASVAGGAITRHWLAAFVVSEQEPESRTPSLVVVQQSRAHVLLVSIPRQEERSAHRTPLSIAL